MKNFNSTLYLNIIWHQHQPLYLDPESDQLRGPWVRTHATKDYYDMAAMLTEFPDVHCTFNLTSSLLVQLEDYYIARLRPFVDVKKLRIDTEKFFAAWKGKTDPWIDLALKPTTAFDDMDKRLLLNDTWNAFHITDVMLGRFPEYGALKEKHGRGERLSEQELRNVKFWFFLAYFDPDFLEQPVQLVDGSVIDLTDLVGKQSDGTYLLRKIITEDDCNRIIVEAYKVMVNIIPVHKKLMYHPKTHIGQIDIITTPFYHPILPLLVDSDTAKNCQPNDLLPQRFHYPQDADIQVAKAITYYRKTFGSAPRGLWPAEGAVSQDIIGILRKNNIQWLATDEHILARSTPADLPKYYPYSAGGEDDIAIVFRDTTLSDKIGFTYQSWKGADAANDFVNNVLQYAPPSYEPDRLLTVILDGENAWEWYKQDNDGKEFLRTLYNRLSAMYKSREVVTVTMSEYISGNPKRHIQPHPIKSMNAIERLHAGSWINANYDTWIGNNEKNQAWEYLRTAREDLERSGVSSPASSGTTPAASTKRWYAYKAWEAIYAAEGSDWFWWYGTKQYVPGGTKPFDASFIGLLNTVYRFAHLAGGSMPQRTFTTITSQQLSETSEQGTMKQSAVPVSQQSSGV
jgi:alpha-amylase/alpha-mannosidase (GH57 family)